MKVKKKLLSLLIAAVMLIGMLPMGAVTVMADDGVNYLYYDNGSFETGTKYSGEYTVVKDSSTTVTWNAGWYVVKDTVTISGRITVNGAVYLILADGSSLTASSGITVSGTSNSLTIYGQENNSGKLTANESNNSAGIGGTSGTSGNNITINGGIITATGNWGAGIGGGLGAAGSNITINGGTVTATSVDGGAGIGGCNSYGSNITINGGTVIANGSGGSAGIGGSRNSSGNGYAENIKITGGTVKATGGSGGGAGIGGGSYRSGKNITIEGGTVEATGGGDGNNGGAGIGGGVYSNASSSVEISSGYITAIGGTTSTNAIGNGSSSSYSSTITITGGYYADTEATVGTSTEGGEVYDVTVASGYSVCNNTEDASKADYPYVVLDSANTVTIKWMDDDTVIDTQVVKTGSTITEHAAYNKADDDTYSYTFTGWTPTFSSTASADATYTAQYTGGDSHSGNRL
ncbi:MAG: hypothetical protein LUE88_01535 [Clostridiales bacterium]|nr:hypothetical protein [Clostridiales bacterium]